MAVLFNHHIIDSNISTILFLIGFVITILLITIICCTNPPSPHRNGVYVVKYPKNIKNTQYHNRRYLTQPIRTVSLNIACTPNIKDMKQGNILFNGLSTTLPVSKSAKLDAIIQFTRQREYDNTYNKSGVKVVSCNRSFF
uniref:Peptidase S1 domain-containing protein n=1 Tax=Strongyloides stercoralis TaxID=6248 RepID=A0A0K0EPT5_STRER